MTDVSRPLFRTGHVTHTFGDVRLDEVLDAIARIGYAGVEPFEKDVLPYYRTPETFRALLEVRGLALSSVYYEAPLLDPAAIRREIERGFRAARFVAELGAEHLVVGPGPMPAGGLRPNAYTRMARALDELGTACRESGVRLCYHPHVGGTVETREQIGAVFDDTDPEVVFFVPDTGHLAKGGSDIVEVVTTYRTRVRLLHLKDMDEHRTFVELGRGRLDNRTVLDLLAHDGYRGWVIPEIPPRDLPPEASAAVSYRALLRLIDAAIGGPERS